MFERFPLNFAPGLYANRARRASQQRWVDGNHVRFQDDVPSQMGGWRQVSLSGAAVVGRPCGMLGWRSTADAGKFVCIGTHLGAFLFDGGFVSDITPSDISGGLATSLPGIGYGSGPYGSEDYGMPRSVSGLILDASSWSMDMFGEYLIACFTGDGKIRSFLAGTDSQLATIDGAPTARAICASQDRHLFAFGCDGNPRLVKWSDREDPTEWTPLPTNRAGGYEMQVASPFQCGLRVGGNVLGLTETDVAVFSPSFNAAVYSRDTLSEASGTVGARSACVASDRGGEIAVWWGSDGFHIFDGVVRRLPCELHDYVFRDINLIQRAKFEASTNNEFNEVRFSYCSAASDEIDRCVVLSLRNGAWSKAHIDRTCWLDRRIFPKPLAMSATGLMYEHEIEPGPGIAAVPSFVTSHPIEIANGNVFCDVSAFWPDMEEGSAGAALTLIARDYSGDDPVLHGPYAFLPETEKIDLYVSARQIQVQIAGTGGHWEIGNPAISWQAGGLA